MSDWKECKIGDLGKIITGKTPRTAISANYGGDMPFLSPSDNMDLKYVGITNKTLTPKGVNEVKNCVLPPKSVCVSCIGSDLGKVILTTQPTITNQQINSIVLNSENDPDFVYYLMSIVGRQLNYISKTSTAVPIINKSAFSNYKVSLPPLAEQKKIAAILSSLDEKIETNRKINARLEELAQTLFKSWFIDFEPFGGQMPEDWDTKPIDEVYNIKYGKGLSKSDLLSDGYPVYGANGIIGFFDQTNVNKIVTLITSRGNGSGDLSYTKHKHAFITNNSFIVEPKTRYSYIEFPFIYQSFCQMDFKSLCSGSAQPQLTNSAISSLDIVIPPKDIIIVFSQFTSPLYGKILSLYHESARLAELRDTLLPKLMSGELACPDDAHETT